MDVQAQADGLRELADWIEANAEVLSGHSDFSHNPTLLLCRLDPEEFVATATALDPAQSEVAVKSGYLNVTRAFGPVRVQVYIDADKVGESTTRMRPTTEWAINPEIRDALGREVVI